MTQNQWHGCDWKRADKINWIGSKAAVLTVLFLYPVFDEKILDAEGSLRGRIRLSVILWLVLQVLFDGHTRRMLKGFLK